MKHKILRKMLLVSALVTATAMVSPVVAQEPESPASASAEVGPVCGQFYENVTTQAQKIIRGPGKTTEQKQEELGVLFNKAVDTNWIGKFVLGRFWKTATPEEHKEYLDLYRQYLTKIYVSKFDDDDISNFELKLASMTRNRSGDIAAKTMIQRPGQQDVHVDYTLTEVGGECRVHDIVIENVSLLSSQRSEFQALAGRSGIAGVIEAIKKQLS